MVISRPVRPSILALAALAGCCHHGPEGSDPIGADGGCHTAAGVTEAQVWESLWQSFATCVSSHSTEECRTQVEQQEWAALPGAGPGTWRTALLGTVAPGGSQYASPEMAPEGDLCVSHDDIDWNLNVWPDPSGAAMLQPGNLTGDADHPGDGDAGVVEAEWEAMYVDPAFAAWPGDAGSPYEDFARPSIDMAVGDRVALRGAGVLDCGHAPYRSELHPPYLLAWGGLRDGGTSVVHVRATARFTRPEEFVTLPDPPEPGEALRADFPLPPPPEGGAALSVTTSVDWFLDDPAIVVDQGCSLTAGVSAASFAPNTDADLASPAAHLVGDSSPAAASDFFYLSAGADGGRLWVEIAPVSRPRQAVFGATVRAAWIPSDGGS